MATRIQIYKAVKNLRASLNIVNFNLKYPRGNAQVWKDELKILKTEENKRLIDNLTEQKDFNGVLSLMIRQGKDFVMSNLQANRFINDIRAEGKMLINVNYKNSQKPNETLTLNEQGLNKLYDMLTANNEDDDDDDDYDGYDGDINSSWSEPAGPQSSNGPSSDNYTALTVSQLQTPNRVITNRDGGFFTYNNMTDLDLSKYQIYTEQQTNSGYTIANLDNCLIHSLTLYGISKSLINNIKLAFITGYNIKKRDLKTISEIINRNITIIQYDGNKQRQTKYRPENPSTDEPLKIAIYENHYFIYEETIYSKFSIDNYELIKNEKDRHRIFERKGKNGKNYYKRNDKYKIDSLTLIRILHNNNHFKKLDFSMFDESSKKNDLKNHIYLDNIKDEQKPYKYKPKESKEKAIYYADCETFTQPFGLINSNSNNSDGTINDNHRLLAIGLSNDIDDTTVIYSIDDKKYITNDYDDIRRQMTNDFLRNMVSNSGDKEIICYFHNLKYDYNILIPYLYIIDKCEKNNQLYSVSVLFNRKKITFQDSYKIISMSLSKFKDNFGLTGELGKMEAIAYDYYKEENIGLLIKPEEYEKLLPIKEVNIFREMVKSFDFENQTVFNPYTYYKDYLRLDCLTLKHGLKKFNEQVCDIKHSNLKIYDYLTISSITDTYMGKNDAYDGVCSVRFNLRDYINKAVYGGRVSVNELYKKKVIHGKISDYDGVS